MYQEQRDLARLEKDYSISEMSTTLAHELNQPLAAIATYLQGSIRYLKNKTYDKKELLMIMQQAASQTKKAGEIIHHMKAQIPTCALSKEKININDTLKETVRLIQQEVKQHQAVIEAKFGKFLPALNIDTLQIKQAFISIINVSLQIMKYEKILFPCIAIKSIINQKNQIEIHIINKGAWINSQNSQALFDSYFMTAKKRLNLGLSIARTILHAHNGKLEIYPGSSEGACFKCILPIA